MRSTAQFFKILADEARLQILWLLFNHRELCVCDLMAALDITQSKASRHLSTLKHAGLVTDRKEGLWSFYAVKPVHDELSRQLLDVLREGLTKRADATRLLVKLHDSVCGSGRTLECSEGNCCTVSKNQPPKERPSRRGSARAQGDRI